MERSLSTITGPLPAPTATAPALGLDPPTHQLRALLYEAVDRVVGILDRLPTAAVSDRVDGVLIDEAVRRPPARDGRTLTELLAVVDRAAGSGLNTPSAGNLAFVPSGGLVSAAVADLLDGYTAPGPHAIETGVLRWLADLFGLPVGSAGLVTTGASTATLSAVVAARTARLPADFLTGTIYVTEQTHRSVAKAARIAGLPPEAIRTVPTDRDLRMDPDALRGAVIADRSWGRQPFCVVATAGTTNTGVVDPLPEIADVAAQQGLWLHVDAAYGGFFQLTDRGRRRLRGIERADSITADAHRGLFLPLGTGVLLVRDGSTLREAHPDEPHTDEKTDEETDLPGFAAHGPEPTRPLRGLRLWLPLHLHGVDAFRSALDDRLDLAVHVYRQLAADALFDVPAAPQLSTVAFRLRHGDTAELLRRVNAERRVSLFGSRIHGRYTGRICVLNHRADRARVDAAVDALRRHGSALSAR